MGMVLDKNDVIAKVFAIGRGSSKLRQIEVATALSRLSPDRFAELTRVLNLKDLMEIITKLAWYADAHVARSQELSVADRSGSATDLMAVARVIQVVLSGEQNAIAALDSMRPGGKRLVLPLPALAAS